MFTSLTVDQLSLIGAYKGSTRCQFLGIDQNDLPVIRFRDKRRLTEPFAVPRSTRRRGAVDPAYPLRQFTDAELDVIDPAVHELLRSLWHDV